MHNLEIELPKEYLDTISIINGMFNKLLQDAIA